MDNEVSNSVHIAISLVVVAVIVGMLALFTAMSQGFGREAVASIADTQAETYATELRNTADYGAVPAAAAFIVLEKNRDAIHSLSGTVYGVMITKPEDLQKRALLSKKVRLTATEIEELQTYDVVVEEEDE
ncbi:hypothetical protein [Cohnella fermenti]|uniref:Uncharacterized protein n=1 Tax=Cohnella fermenti TaxID=2565925 RepID=A0A4S4BJD0_9BACL|nr:hypothetical protein [Cohnella fermenti]THF74762.1 hypothetical protein E6C55_24450 [Cohnella fermenti]